MMSGDDAKCARSCIKNGTQYALVAGDKVYPLKGRSEELNRFVAQSITVKGSLVDSVLVVSSVAPPQSSTAVQASADGNDTPPPVTIQGLVRDVACPIQNNKASARVFNLKCAQDCAKLGSPLIVLTDDGTLYTPISESMPDKDQRERLMPFLGKYVRVTGPVFERNGTHAIAVRTIEELKNVALKTDAE
jgi:DNA/RNA endonuclease YhcR with UshA esterase domain